jgi:ectoine hydroxylase-related dioxygenase (phytanoyl-CoA dioxygenase family)
MMNAETDLQSFNEDGFVVLRNLIPERLCEEYEKLLDTDYQKFSSIYADGKHNKDIDLANKSGEKVVFNLHNKSLKWMQLFENQTVISLLDNILKEGSYGNREPYYLNNISARSPKKGFPGQQLHIDSNLPGINYPIIVNVLWLINDFTEANGATRIVPGSHKWKYFPPDGVRHKDEILVEAEKGSAIVFNANLWHGGGENTLGENRWAVALGYARWFIKPSFDFMHNTPLPIYDELTTSQKELLGFNLIPPKDEFTRMRRRSIDLERPNPYSLPD